MSVRLYADEFRVAIYEEAPGGGEADDPNSLMNRPVLDPINWMANIFFHSDLTYFGIVAHQLTTINHAFVGGGSFPITPSALVTINGQTARADHLLLTHNLGYVPKFFVLYNNRMIPLGFPIQINGNVATRFVAAYATTTQVRLAEFARSSSLNLDAVSRTYTTIVFRDAEANPIGDNLDIRPGVANFAHGKFRAQEPHLRADGLGDVQWPIQTGRAVGVRNGGFRFWEANGGNTDYNDYNGSLPAPGYIMTSAGI